MRALSLGFAAVLAAAAPLAAQSELDARAAGLQWLEVPDQPTGPFQLQVSIDGLPQTLKLSPWSLRSDHFEVLVQGPSGALHSWPAPAPQTWRGKVVGFPASDVRLSLEDGVVRGTIRSETGEEWGLQPARDLDATAPEGAYVTYRPDQLAAPAEADCGTLQDFFDLDLPPGPGYAGTGLRVCEVAFDADREFYQSNGSSVASTVADIENVMNLVEAIYENDVQVTFEITVIVVRTSEPDPYSQTDPTLLLGQVGNEWNNNLTGWPRDLVHMMTGKNLNGSVIGIANGTVCGGYALSQSKFSFSMTSRAALTAHEMGHNFGAGHCNGNPGGCNIMCSSLGGCGPITSFAPVSVGIITTVAAAKVCLADQAPPIAPPFVDGLAQPAIDTAFWLTNDDVDVVDIGLNVPSPPWVADFSASGTAAHLQDGLWSNDYLLGSGGPWMVTFYSQHVGVEAGEDLVVEYLDSGGNWVEMARLTSDGVDQDHFSLNVFPVPAAGLYDGSRFRLVGEMSDSSDHWYVDEIGIVDAQPCELPFGYCTAKQTSEGCLPFMTAVGTPSASAASVFDVGAQFTIALKPGLLFYGYAPAALPFQGGTLCVQPPTRRTGTQLASGSPAFPCDGSYGFDMNALIQSGLDPLLVPGATVDCQYWFRDNGAPSLTGLTNGLQFEICN